MNKSWLTGVFIVLLAAAVLWPRYGNDNQLAEVVNDTVALNSDRQIAELYQNRESNVFVTVSGRVTKILADDREGARHQRFLVRLDSGHTLLVSHNIDLARRINGLQVSDRVSIRGEYEWNSKGGVIHWTHHDPQGRLKGGWIEHENRRYR